MNAPSSAPRVLVLAVLAAAVLGNVDCDYRVPITPHPTRAVDPALLGDWVSEDGGKEMKVRSLGDSTYVGVYEGDLFLAFHSDLAGTAFVNVQELDSPERRYAYVAYRVYDEGRRLALRSVRTTAIPGDVAESAAVRKAIEAATGSGDLLEDEEVYRKSE